MTFDFQKIRDFLGDISGYRPLYLAALGELAKSREVIEQLTQELEEAKEKIRQLELLVPRPVPPDITVIQDKDAAWLQQRIDGMDLSILRLGLDGQYRLTDQSNFLNIVAWDWCDSLEYIKELFDCENFAILFKAFVDLYFKLNQVAIIIDYQMGHGYNLVVYPDGNIAVLEPQTDALWVWSQRPTEYILENSIALI